MEYFVSVTHVCNLKCSFCFWKDTIGNAAATDINPKELKRFIGSNRDEMDGEKDHVVFYGGEPLLNQPLIKEIIDEFQVNEPIMFSLFTNGILLNKIDDRILERLSYIFVSLEGNEELNATYRGKGLFNKVVRNVRELRQGYKGEIAARLLVPTSIDINYSLYESVMGIINDFDHIFWGLESSAEICQDQETQLYRYSQDLEKLLDVWLTNMAEGHFINIIPFQTITKTILLNQKADSLKCGAGTSYLFIDSDGQCYVCDELVDYEEFHVGDIRKGTTFSGGINFQNYIDLCNKCSVKDICGGLCIAGFVKHPPEKFRLYCQFTKSLINQIKGAIPRIKSIMELKGYSIINFDTFLTSNVFEQIP